MLFSFVYSPSFFQGQREKLTLNGRIIIVGDATLSRHKGINMADLALHTHLASTPSGETWRGRWQNNDIVAKILNVRECTARISRDFNEEFPKLRIFSHPNVLPVLGCVNQPPQLATVSQYMARGSLHRLLHGGTGVVVDTARALRLALDVARAMAFLHGLERQNRCRFQLNSKHIMVNANKCTIAPFTISIQIHALFLDRRRSNRTSKYGRFKILFPRGWTYI